MAYPEELIGLPIEPYIIAQLDAVTVDYTGMGDFALSVIISNPALSVTTSEPELRVAIVSFENYVLPNNAIAIGGFNRNTGVPASYADFGNLLPEEMGLVSKVVDQKVVTNPFLSLVASHTIFCNYDGVLYFLIQS